MESPLDPVLTDVITGHLENTELHISINGTKFYTRLADDTSVVTETTEQAEKLLDFSNSCHTSIELPIEQESEEGFSLLRHTAEAKGRW